jgi:hypothetical protein
MNCAPILITVYDRIDHLRQCIESLLACPEAKFSTIYIASDAAANEKQTPKIESVRSFLKKITGFKEVILIFRSINVGAVENSKLARIEIFKKYDRLIRMEDDVIVGNKFLSFINNGLEIYKNEEKVIYVCGYLPPGIINQNNRSFFLRTMTPYGFGMWREKEYALEKFFNKKTIEDCFRSTKFFIQYEKLNPHCPLSLSKVINGNWLPGDIVRGVIMARDGYLALFPPTAISKSIGHDGSGIHSTSNDELQNQKISNEFFELHSDATIEHNLALEKKTAKYWKTPTTSIKNYLFYFLKIKYPSLNFFLKLAKKITR